MNNVDTTSPISHVSLCAGYGGIDLGLRRVLPTLRTIAYSEREGFCCANLVSKIEAGLMDVAPIWTDVKTFPWEQFRGCVDILSGGYPCQPFSSAGKRLGAEDPRHLWPHISAGIAQMRPGACFFENVEGHISLGLSDVIEDLGRLGYRTTWCVASASECGAPHQRKRIFILAYDQRQRVEELGWQIAGASQFDTAGNDGGDAGCGELADANRGSAWHRQAHGLSGSEAGRKGLQQEWQADGDRPQPTGGDCCQTAWPSRPGEQQYEWEPPRVVGAIPNAQNVRLEEQSECGQQSQEGESGTLHVSRVCSLQAQEGRPLEHASHWSNGEQPTEQQRRDSVGGSSEAGAMGNATSEGPQERSSRSNHSSIQATECGGGSEGDRQAESPLGRDADGLTHRLDHAVLHVSTDNRTDELRLLGNGVVPATAERAFRVLVGELM